MNSRKPKKISLDILERTLRLKFIPEHSTFFQKNLIIIILHNGHVVCSIEADVVHLGDEDGGHGDKQGRPVHVDRRADREDELGDAAVDSGFLQTLEADGESGCSVIMVT